MAALAALDGVIDRPPRQGRWLMITAPTTGSAVQGDCDCACPVISPPQFPTNSVDFDTHLRLHPLAQFVALSPEEHLLYIPSVLSGVIVNAGLRAWLLGLGRATPVRDLLAAMPEVLLARCVALGILVDEAPPAGPAAGDSLVAWLHVTNACNLRCTYCYLNKTEEPMSAETGYAAIDAIIRSARRHGYRAIKLKFAGGEASLNFPLVWNLERYAREQAAAHALELDAVLLSNGVGLTRSNLIALQERAIGLMISLDGLAAEHDTQRVFANGRGSFHQVVRAIERACAIGLRPHISVTVSSRTASGLAELVAWLLARDLPFNLNFYRENDCSAGITDLKLDEARIVAGMLAAFEVIETHLPERSLLASLVDRANLAVAHARPCGVGENYLVIDQRGGVAKCQMEIERPITTVHVPDPLGIIREDTIGVRNPPVQARAGCRDCAWRFWCAGGCPITTFRATGRYDIQSPNCGIYKALYPAAMRLEGLRLLKYGIREYFGDSEIPNHPNVHVKRET